MQDVRKAGFQLIGIGLVGIAVVVWLVYNPGAVKVMAFIPLAVVLIGIVVAVTGTPVQMLSARWMALAGWQRGILGLLLALTSLLAAIIIARAALHLLSQFPAPVL